MSQKRRAVGLSCRLPQKYKRGQAALGSIYIVAWHMSIDPGRAAVVSDARTLFACPLIAFY